MIHFSSSGSYVVAVLLSCLSVDFKNHLLEALSKVARLSSHLFDIGYQLFDRSALHSDRSVLQLRPLGRAECTIL